MLSKAGYYIRTYWKIIVAPLGASLLAIAVSEEVQKIHPYMERGLIAVGILLSVVGAVIASEVTTTNKRLENELEEAKKLREKRVFLILAARLWDLEIANQLS